MIHPGFNNNLNVIQVNALLDNIDISHSRFVLVSLIYMLSSGL